jgi:hypothetical protein
MPGLTIGRGCAACAVLFALAAPAAAETRPFGALATPDPVSEAGAPADPALAAACQASARERFGQERLTFGRPSHTRRDTIRIVRMDVTAAGEPFRAVCTRDDAAGPVETVVFAGPADEAGPRVIVLGGPTPGARPRADDGYRYFVRDPSAGAAENPVYGAYGGGYLSGLWGDSFDGRSFGTHVVRRDGSRARRGRPAIDAVAQNPRFFEVRRGSSAPFSTGGVASPAFNSFSPKVVRGGASIRFRSGGFAGSFGR